LEESAELRCGDEERNGRFTGEDQELKGKERWMCGEGEEGVDYFGKDGGEVRTCQCVVFEKEERKQIEVAPL
jgi:hypothetical protein